MQQQSVVDALVQLGYPHALAPSIGRWVEGACAVLAAFGEEQPKGKQARLLRDLMQIWLIVSAPPGEEGVGVLSHVGAEGRRRLLSQAGGGGLALAVRERMLAHLAQGDDEHLAAGLLESTQGALALVESLRDGAQSLAGSRLGARFPELRALLHAEEWHARVDPDRPAHQRQSQTPLLDHVCRVLGKLAAAESGAWAQVAPEVEAVRDAGLWACVRAALLFLDFTKGGEPSQRQHWASVQADLSVHNLASARVLEADEVLSRFAYFRQHPERARLVVAMVAGHGVPGQTTRGETPLVFMAPFARYLRAHGKALADHLGVSVEQARALACQCALLVNACDTAGVREGLMDDALLAAFRSIFADVLAAGASPTPDDEAFLAHREAQRWDHQDRARLADRLRRLRAGRLRSGEPPQAVLDVLDGLDPDTLHGLFGWFRCCQLWYAEAATGALSPDAQLKVLALGMRAAKHVAQVDVARPYNVSLMPLVRRLNPAADRAAPYRIRLMEVLLGGVALRDIVNAPYGALAIEQTSSVLGTFRAEIGGAAALTVAFDESAEAKALLTLLPIYEAKSSAAFHATLKALCDLYGLRKDAFDRVSNEAQYLVHMNSARSDKSRMLDFVQPGRIVEIGPGGGVILNLLEDRYPASEIIGLDVSRMVVEALLALKAKDHHRWAVIEADAFEMTQQFGENALDTVIFCSLLHEIYSYVEYPDAAGQKGRFRLESVRDLLRAAYKTLKPGGRIIIRDGVKPPPSERILRFCTDDALGFFRLFVDQFEGRTIQARWLDPRRVLLSSEDAMEFLYTYTWGPESFPYEVREQYGILTYDEYQQNLLRWLDDPQNPPVLVPIPEDLRSYLQPGYQKGLEDQVALYDAHDQPVRLPDSNCLLVIQKSSRA